MLSAEVGDTAILSIYGPEWPGQAMRAIVNDGARVALGREPDAIRDAEGQIIGSTVLNGQKIPVPRYSAILPTRDFDGDIEQACLTAGQSAGNIYEILSAGAIVRRMTSEAKAALDGLAAMREAADVRPSSSDDIADELLDVGQDGLLIACEDPVIGTVELDERRLRDVAGEMPAGTDAYGAVALPVEHERRNRNFGPEDAARPYRATPRAGP